MTELRYCGICGEKNTYKEFCITCEQRSARLTRAIQKKLSHLDSVKTKEANAN